MNMELENEIKKLKQENAGLKKKEKELEPYKIIHEKRLKTTGVAYFVEPLVIGGESYAELSFRRPTGRDVATIMSLHSPQEKIHQLARSLCPELSTMSDDDFLDLDYGNYYKEIGDIVEGFM